MTEAKRPDPDALLKAARREARGRLKIFLGAAPGVGKTYRMLLDGAALLREGRDVVVGLVETHGRADTGALLAPFEVLPRREIRHGAHRVGEFDLDAMLARAPQVALVDELAHSNPPGSRHPKRWQDIEELRNAGIDVLTTLNIQHVESLNDAVAGFTRVRVRETVPDTVLDDAEIEVIDLPPDELITRLRDGKVYIPEEASRALDHFFSRANLSALRELALRRAAQVVDRRMIDEAVLSSADDRPAVGQRILVAVGPGTDGPALVRAGRRLADAWRAPWSVVTVETPRGGTTPGTAGLAATLDLATALGATLATVPAASVPQGLAGYIRETRATTLVLGQSRHPWWRRATRGTLAERLAQALPGVALHVVPSGEVGRREAATRGPWPWRGSALGLALVALTTLANIFLAGVVGTDPVDMIYLVPVIATATLAGLRPALVTSFAAALAYNFFFLDPRYTLTIQNPQNVITFLVLAGVGAVASQLAGRLRREATVGVRTASENAAIAAFGQRLASVSTEADTASAICGEIAALMDASCVLVMPGDPPRIVASAPGPAELGTIDFAAADFALARGEVTGRDSTTLTASDWQFHPLKTALGVLAAIGVSSSSRAQPVPPEKRLLFATLLGQAALAHERLLLEGEARRATALQQRDDLRTTLVSSLGHDLKTPLTAVVAAAEALAEKHAGSPEAATLLAQAHRLRRLFDDLVEMTRIESGALIARSEATDLVDAVAAAVHDLRDALSGHRLDLQVPPGLPLVRADPRMLHHVLVNLLENAAKYAPAGTPITIEGKRPPAGLSLSILDAGPGIPAGEDLFARFSRGTMGDRIGGTGLGLAIVKGFAEAMGLAVSAGRRDGEAGSRFTLVWPEELLVREDRQGGEE